MLFNIICFIFISVVIITTLWALKEIWIACKEILRLNKEWEKIKREQEESWKKFCLHIKTKAKKQEEDRLKKKFFIN